jgi:hypothetical protein
MARLLVLVSPPPRLKVDEAESWLREKLAPLVRAAGLRSAVLSRMAAASPFGGDAWAWLVEFDFDTPESARGAVDEDAWALLLGDLRLVGMSPTVAFVESPTELMP